MKRSQLNAFDPRNTCDSVINETYESLKLSHHADIDVDFNFDFSNFELFNHYESHTIGAVIRIEYMGLKGYITFTQVSYKINSASKFPTPPTLEWQIWGIAYLKNNYGHILIKPETILDKVHELINPQEIDFEDDKNFSKKYYVVTNDEFKARLQMTPMFRKCISNIKLEEFVIEIIEDKVIFGNKKKAQTETAFEFARLFEVLTSTKQ